MFFLACISVIRLNAVLIGRKYESSFGTVIKLDILLVHPQTMVGEHRGVSGPPGAKFMYFGTNCINIFPPYIF